MFKGKKFKMVAAVMLLTGMLCSGMTTQAGVALGIGETNVPYNTGAYRKTTSNKYSDLALGDVSIYDQILACTYSRELGGGYAQSNPWTVCPENQTTYLGQYVSLEAYVGQYIYLRAERRSDVTETYAAEFDSWDYQ